ncbi:MAG: NAD(P)/FAD-dependent oxidoreductase [Negativicutes bacterium]|nr:NAD(P)/FAD-dependent oxidoreductase [Negativicutes bacterium]
MMTADNREKLAVQDWPGRADVVIVGGGIVGCAAAMFLSRYKATVVMVEQATDLAMGTTKANSGIIHAGFDAPPGSMKARMNVRGNRLYHELQPALKYEVNFLGSLVVAKSDDDLKTLEGLLDRGRQNGVPDITIIDRERVLSREPNLSRDVRAGLWAPTAGVIWPFGAALAMAENAVRNGVKVFTGCRLEGFMLDRRKICGVRTNKGDIACKLVINAAGRWADEVSRWAGDDSFSITPRRGEYILFDKSVGSLVNSVLFPTPTKVSKGILVSPTVHGNIFIGPNAENITDKDDLSTTAPGMEEIISGARKLIPDLPLAAAITQFVGLRPVASGDDFIIGPSALVGGLVQAAGIQSPGLASAPAIGELVSEIAAERLGLVRKPGYVEENPDRPAFAELDSRQRQELIARNPLYGRIICRCETVSEGEIVAAIHSPVGARTVDGVKRRTRAGMGRCQGGFCGPRVVGILARELGLPLDAIVKEGPGSQLFFARQTLRGGESHE